MVTRAESKDRLIEELRHQLSEMQAEDRDVDKLREELDAAKANYNNLQVNRIDLER